MCLYAQCTLLWLLVSVANAAQPLCELAEVSLLPVFVIIILLKQFLYSGISSLSAVSDRLSQLNADADLHVCYVLEPWRVTFARSLC